MGEVTTTHPAAEAFPMHDQDELNRLAVDIVQNGLRHPIITTPDGQVLDGRNRLAACRLVNVDPSFEVYDGDPWAYSRSVNLHVRNMTTGQKAAACALSLLAEGKRKDGRWARGSVPNEAEDNPRSWVSSGWEEAMRRAGFVLDWSEDLDLIASVRDGKTALDAAYTQAKARKDRADWEAAQAAKAKEQEIARNDAELAALLSLGHNQLQLSLDLIKEAQDTDNWRGVQNLAPKIIAMWTRLKEQADAQLDD
jgi:hypothetical protein